MGDTEKMKSYTAAELKVMKAVSQTDLSRVDAMTDAALEKIIADDPDEKGLAAISKPLQSPHIP